jgi:hypothetical protein
MLEYHVASNTKQAEQFAVILKENNENNIEISQAECIKVACALLPVLKHYGASSSAI